MTLMGIQPTPVRRSFAAPVFLWLLLAGTAIAAPFRPSSDQHLLLEIPAAERSVSTEIQDLRTEFDAQAGNAALAERLTRLYFDLHQRLGDPRLIGYAESVLEHHRAAIAPLYPGPPLLLAQARIQQARHDFAGARETLESLLQDAPEYAPAWLMLASVALVQGDYDQARRGCARVTFSGRPDAGLVCAASLASLRGDSDLALRQLQKRLARGDTLAVELREWAHTVAAEIAMRRGLTELAEQHLTLSLALSPALYPRLLFADLLIEQRRFDKADRLLRTAAPTDAVLIRKAQIARHLNDKAFSEQRQRLTQRMAQSNLRGDTGHDRERALFELTLKDDPAMAVAAAAKNWQSQRESLDARVLLQAALAANQPEYARPVLDWMRSNNSDDRRLLLLQDQLALISP